MIVSNNIVRILFDTVSFKLREHPTHKSIEVIWNNTFGI